jgi:hypothetical protein
MLMTFDYNNDVCRNNVSRQSRYILKQCLEELHKYNKKTCFPLKIMLYCDTFSGHFASYEENAFIYAKEELKKMGYMVSHFPSELSSDKYFITINTL